MTIDQILITFIGIACAVIGWFARVLYQATQELRKDLSALEVKISRDYVRYDRLQDMFKPVLEGIHEIKEALRSKADK